MKKARPETRYASLLSNLLDSQEKGTTGRPTHERREVVNLADVSENLALMHRALEQSSATGQP